MNDHISKIHYQPAFAGLTFDAAAFLVIFFCGFEHAFGQRVQHTVAGAVAPYKIISKGCDVLNIEKQNVLALFVLEGFDDLMCKFECVQVSPLLEGISVLPKGHRFGTV